MDFFAHQERAKRNTIGLIFYYVITIVLIVIFVYVCVTGVVSATTLQSNQFDFYAFHPLIFAEVVGSVLVVILSGSLYKNKQIGGDGNRVAMNLGGVKLLPNSLDLDERVLFNVVEEMALASGTVVPPVYILEEDGINAFAAGTSPQNTVIGVTRGCIKTLSRDELQGVIAHEFSHILNGDMILNLRLIGLLFGIQLIALIGYFCFRLVFRVSWGGNGKNSKSNLGLVAVLFISSLALMFIGYVGVLFAKLIQCRVSREREFLADASAVQFTRSTSGIANALKRIGGWKKRSLLKTSNAMEASHMFFGEGVVSYLLATHPPLEARIRRIEPNFDGKFLVTKIIQHSESDIIDPNNLKMNRMKQPSSHVSALVGAQQFERKSALAVEHVGNPVEAHINHAQRLVCEMHPLLVREVHDPMGAVAIVYALLLARESSQIRGAQLEIIVKYQGVPLRDEVLRVLSLTDSLQVEQRLPLACMALPALDQLSDPQVGALRISVHELIQADKRLTIFEYALQRFITKRLILRSHSPKPSVKPTEKQFDEAVQAIMSAVVHLGGNSHAESAYEAGMIKWKNGSQLLPMLERDQCTLSRFDKCLDLLHAARPAIKRTMLDAFSSCIAHDKRTSINEIELLRVISDALGCPMPPVIPEA